MLAIAGVAFCWCAPAATTVSMWLYDRAYDRELAALDHVPQGARMVSFVGRPCIERWAMPRLLHLPAHGDRPPRAFSNDQWPMAGAQLLQRPLPAAAGRSSRDPSQIVTARSLPRTRCWRASTSRSAILPRDAFDYVWLIDCRRPYDAKLDRWAAAGLARAGRACSTGSTSNAKSDTPNGNGTRPIR